MHLKSISDSRMLRSFEVKTEEKQSVEDIDTEEEV